MCTFYLFTVLYIMFTFVHNLCVPFIGGSYLYLLIVDIALPLTFV